jgi:FkbM family methyltransferase
MKVLLGREPWVSRDLHVAVVHLGSEYGRSTISPRGLDPTAVVYSLGVGEDVSFDLALIRRFGVTVHAFDPLPRVRDWVRSQQLPERFHFHGVAVAGFDGLLTLHPPPDPSHVSYSVTPRPGGRGLPLQVPARRLGTILRDLGHDHVDLLKVDVEGSEYEVLEDLLESSIAVTQLVVEFHHRFPGVGRERTREAVAALRSAGFGVFHVSSRSEISFLKRMGQSS